MKYLILSLLVLSLILSGCTTIGGERDKHGCLVPAGYKWDQNISACIRDWELNKNQRLGAKVAVSYLDYEYATTIIKVQVMECSGCFEVKLEQGVNRDQVSVTLTDWKLEEKIMTRHICREEEKQAEICTMEYVPVCGFKSDETSRTYGNGCGACADKVEYWEYGECKEISE